MGSVPLWSLSVLLLVRDKAERCACPCPRYFGIDNPHAFSTLLSVHGHSGICIIIVSIHSYTFYRAQELCESRGCRSGLPVPNKPDGFCGRKATINSYTF